jgi:hypothetical protein
MRDGSGEGQYAATLRWTSAAMLEATNGFRHLKAYKQLSVLRTAPAHQTKRAANSPVELAAKAAWSVYSATPAKQIQATQGQSPFYLGDLPVALEPGLACQSVGWHERPDDTGRRSTIG